MESFNHPLDIGSCRRQVLLPVIEKRAALTVPSVPVAVPSVLSVPDYNPNPKSDYNPNPNHVNHVTFLDARLGHRLPRGRANSGPHSKRLNRWLQTHLTTDQYLQCYCRRKTLAMGRYPTYIPEKVNLREASPSSAPSQKALCSSFPQNFSVQS